MEVQKEGRSHGGSGQSKRAGRAKSSLSGGGKEKRRPGHGGTEGREIPWSERSEQESGESKQEFVRGVRQGRTRGRSLTKKKKKFS